ncbi:MAG: hypothetical protein U5L07_06085 [Desulfobacterales bacterium]|nr:hypothetical protein [Desulfobacterales bacterium]
MPKRPVTPTYIVFYILFLPDTWQILMGIGLALLAQQFATTPEMAVSSKVLIFIMLATIGYTITRLPARWIAGKIKKFFLGERQQ